MIYLFDDIKIIIAFLPFRLFPYIIFCPRLGIASRRSDYHTIVYGVNPCGRWKMLFFYGASTFPVNASVPRNAHSAVAPVCTSSRLVAPPAMRIFVHQRDTPTVSPTAVLLNFIRPIFTRARDTRGRHQRTGDALARENKNHASRREFRHGYLEMNSNRYDGVLPNYIDVLFERDSIATRSDAPRVLEERGSEYTIVRFGAVQSARR